MFTSAYSGTQLPKLLTFSFYNSCRVTKMPIHFGKSKREKPAKIENLKTKFKNAKIGPSG